MKVLITLKADQVKELDEVAGGVGTNRSAVIRELLDYALENVDEIFPLEEEEEEDEEDEEEVIT